MVTKVEVYERRRELSNKTRHMFNEDGASISYYDSSYGYPLTANGWLGYVFGPHRGLGNHIVQSPTSSDITTMIFNTAASGFTYHRSGIPNMYFGTPYGSQTPSSNPWDATNSIYESTGKDVLEILSEFLSETPVELFFECRVNDTHDYSWQRNELVPLKQDLWDSGGLISNGNYNGLDFSFPDSFDLMLNTVLEVIQSDKWNVDGVSLNFTRHFGLFKNVYGDGTLTGTSQSEIDTVTEWVRLIDEAIVDRSLIRMARGEEPLLLAVKVADHPDFNLAVGLDVAEWARRGYFDLLILGGYQRFQSYKHGVDWGKSLGVTTIQSLEDGRITIKRDRHNKSGVRGYLLQLYGAGSDSVEFFNKNYAWDPHWAGPSGELWRNLGYDKVVSWGDRKYYSTYTSTVSGSLGSNAQVPVERFFPENSNRACSDTRFRLKGSATFQIEVYEKSENINTVSIKIFTNFGSLNGLSFNGVVKSFTTESWGVSAVLDKSELVWGINHVTVSGLDAVVEDVELHVT